MRRSTVALLVVGCTLGSCADGNPSSTGLSVSPTSVTVAVGSSATVTVTAGNPIANLVWSSSDVSVATVTADGGSATITGVAPGQAVVDAQLGALHRSVDVTVVGAAVDRITITAARTVIPLGGTEQLSAQGHRTDNTSADVTQAVTWASRNPGVASVDDRGLVTVHAIGETAITASRDGVTGTLAILVSARELRALAVTPSAPTIAKGLALTLAAKATFSDGAIVDLTAMARWTTSAAAVATVSVDGVVQSVEVGSAMITATINGLSASAAIVVGPPVITAIEITPDPLIMLTDTTQQLSVTSTSSDGTTGDVSARAVWSVAGTTLTVSDTGMAHALANGNSTITAEVDGLSDTLLATIHKPIGLEVSPSVDPPVALTLAQQQRVRFHALLLVLDGGFLDVTTTAIWTSTAPAIATVVAGRVDAQTQSGAATVTATAAGFSAPINVQVTTETCHPVINEVLAEGLSPGDEWIEIYNPCTQTIDVGGWTLVHHGPSGTAVDGLLVTLAGSMAPAAFRLYAGAGYTGSGAAAPDGVWPGPNGILPKGSFGVGLLRPAPGAATRVSGVAFGTVVANPYLEGRPAPELPIAATSGARFPFDGKDTHDGHSDFSTLIPSPKAPNFPEL